MKTLFAGALGLLLMLSAGTTAQSPSGGSIVVTFSAESFHRKENGDLVNGEIFEVWRGKDALFEVKVVGAEPGAYCHVVVKYKTGGVAHQFDEAVVGGKVVITWRVPTNAPAGVGEARDWRGIGGYCKYKDQSVPINGKTSQPSHSIRVY